MKNVDLQVQYFLAAFIVPELNIFMRTYHNHDNQARNIIALRVEVHII